MSDFFHMSTVSTFGLIEVSCEHGNLTAACHDASCRPPTSGGTGGSRPGGSRGKAAPASHAPSEFGRKIQAAIAAEPALAGRKTYAELEAAHEQVKLGHTLAARETMTDRLRKGRFDVQVNPQGRWDAATREMSDNLKAEIKRQIEAGVHHKFIDDPNARAETPVEQMLRNYVRKRLETETYAYAVEHGTMDVRGQFGEPVTFGVSMSSYGIPMPARNLKEFGGEQITPEFEAASTRVGMMIHDEILGRQVAKVSKAEEDYQAAMSDIRAAGIEPAEVNFGRFRDGRTSISYKPSAGKPELTDVEKAQISLAMVTHNIYALDRDIHLLNATRKAKEETFDEVMREILPMGGKIDGTPAHRKGKGALSSNEQALAAASKYPTSWVDASNFRGQVSFKTAKGRGHYQDATGAILLNGSASVAVHELGHRMEYSVPGLKALEDHFYKRRTEERNEEGFLLREPSPVQLSKLFPGSRYAASERTIEDHFFDSYAGKKYPDAYELMTMGMEAVTMGKTGHTSKGDGNVIDADHAAFVLGALVTLVPS